MDDNHDQSKETIRVFVIERYAILREALKSLIDSDGRFTVVGDASDASGASAAGELAPHVILFSYDFDSNDDVITMIANLEGRPRILVLTGNTNLPNDVRAAHFGATGIVSKDEAPRILLRAIEKIHAGEAWFDRATVATVLADISGVNTPQPPDEDSERIAGLTDREEQVVVLVAEGLKTRQIANRLFISEATVRHHLTSIFSKLGVSDRLELIIYAFRHNLAKLP